MRGGFQSTQPLGSFPLSSLSALASFPFSFQHKDTPEPEFPGSSLCLPPPLPITEPERGSPSPHTPKHPSETKLSPSAGDKYLTGTLKITYEKCRWRVTKQYLGNKPRAFRPALSPAPDAGSVPQVGSCLGPDGFRVLASPMADTSVSVSVGVTTQAWETGDLAWRPCSLSQEFVL